MHGNFKSNKLFFIICSVIAVFFIITAVIFGAYKIIAIRYDDLLAIKMPDWQGVINIWHIDSFRTPGGSKAAALRKITAYYEKKFRGVFIEIDEITPEEYLKRISEGKAPDIVSFPAEMNIDISECPQILSQPNLMPIHEVCQNLCDYRAAPWLWTMPMAVINEEFAMKKNINIDSNPTIAEFEDTVNKIIESSNSGIAANEYALINFVLTDMNLNADKIMTCWQAWQAFSQKESYAIFGGLWEIAAMNRLNERNKGFGISVMQVPEGIPGFCWTQWICITSSDEKCIEYSRKFIEMLLSAENQKKAADSTGCMSVLSGQEGYMEYRREAYFREGDLVAMIPGGEITAGTVLQALGGDELARAAVLGRLAVIGNNNIESQQDAVLET